MTQYLWLIPVLPLLGFLINGLGRNHISKTGAGIVACSTIFISFLLSLYAFIEVKSGSHPKILLPLFDWISTGNLSIPFSFLIDPLTCIFLLIITGVGFLIHVYSMGYMHDDEGYAKFFAYLNLFVFFMLVLVMGSSYPILFIGWEGVGLCSYLLIGFWFKNIDYSSAAKKAFIMNRIGDLGFLLGMFLIFQNFGSLNYEDVFVKAQGLTTFNTSAIVAITLLLFVGATGKSAQIPLYTWLPDAMAGPTPVSALIHAATMVTAGIYMIARSSILYVLAPYTMDIVAMIGALTALLAALIALNQNDIKKVLAYSTVSQLGYMFTALGVGAFSSGIFHVMTHAFFKALLFLGAGSVIHAMGNEQDIRKMGALRKFLPITFLTFAVGTIAISGFPPFSGFFSKDEILAAAFFKYPMAFWILSITSILTCVYMFRMFFLTFFGSFRGTEHQKSHLHESPFSMTFPLIVLAVLSAIAGGVGLPEIMGKEHYLKEFLHPVFASSDQLQTLKAISESGEIKLIIVSIIVIIAVAAICYYVFSKSKIVFEEEKEYSFFKKLSANKFYLDELYDLVITKPLDFLSGVFYKVIDLSGIDGIVNSFGKLTLFGSRTLRLAQSGNIGYYIFIMVIGVVLMLMFGFNKI